MSNFQRDGSYSNTHAGRAYERRACGIFAEHGLLLESGHKVACGLSGDERKAHAFGLGSENPQVIVECKSPAPISGGNLPSDKTKNRAVAMFCFHLAPPDYRKICIAKRSVRPRWDESLSSYFMRTQVHMIPADGEFWDLDRSSKFTAHWSLA